MSAPYIHPTAAVDPGARVGEGSSVWHFCHVMSGATIGCDAVLGQNTFVASSAVIGDRCRIQNNVSVYDGVTLEAGVFVGPSAVFTNVRRPRALLPRKDAYEPTLVREGATIGANATIVCGTTIGRAAMIGAGAVVTRDVPDFALATGSPARIAGWVCTCGERLAWHVDGDDLADTSCGACDRRYRRERGRVIVG